MDKFKEIVKNLNYELIYKVSVLILLLLIFILLCKINYNTYRTYDWLSDIDRSVCSIEDTLYKLHY